LNDFISLNIFSFSETDIYLRINPYKAMGGIFHKLCFKVKFENDRKSGKKKN
jgi:hypothetical protein